LGSFSATSGAALCSIHKKKSVSPSRRSENAAPKRGWAIWWAGGCKDLPLTELRSGTAVAGPAPQRKHCGERGDLFNTARGLSVAPHVQTTATGDMCTAAPQRNHRAPAFSSSRCCQDGGGGAQSRRTRTPRSSALCARRVNKSSAFIPVQAVHSNRAPLRPGRHSGAALIRRAADCPRLRNRGRTYKNLQHRRDADKNWRTWKN